VTVPALVLAAAFAVALGSFVGLRLRLGRRLRAPFAPPRASAAAGVRYAFTTAFLPWAKESARQHLPSYAAGIVFHLGIFAGLARLAASLWPVVAWPSWAAGGLALVLTAALACGLGLLVKRHHDATLRAVSTPEDTGANLLADLFLAVGLVTALRPAWLAAFQFVGAALLLYAPLGKLRHMLFLLTSRRYWGVYFGRRGIRPAPRPSAGARG
jgi:hypothetical protein